MTNAPTTANEGPHTSAGQASPITEIVQQFLSAGTGSETFSALLRRIGGPQAVAPGRGRPPPVIVCLFYSLSPVFYCLMITVGGRSRLLLSACVGFASVNLLT